MVFTIKLLYHVIKAAFARPFKDTVLYLYNDGTVESIELEKDMEMWVD